MVEVLVTRFSISELRVGGCSLMTTFIMSELRDDG